MVALLALFEVVSSASGNLLYSCGYSCKLLVMCLLKLVRVHPVHPSMYACLMVFHLHGKQLVQTCLSQDALPHLQEACWPDNMLC